MPACPWGPQQRTDGPRVEGLVIGRIIPAGRPPWGKLFLTLSAEATSLSPSLGLSSLPPGACGPHCPSGGGRQVAAGHRAGWQVALPERRREGLRKRGGTWRACQCPTRRHPWKGVEILPQTAPAAEGSFPIANSEFRWIEGPRSPGVLFLAPSALLSSGRGSYPIWGREVPVAPGKSFPADPAQVLGRVLASWLRSHVQPQPITVKSPQPGLGPLRSGCSGPAVAPGPPTPGSRW